MQSTGERATLGQRCDGHCLTNKHRRGALIWPMISCSSASQLARVIEISVFAGGDGNIAVCRTIHDWDLGRGPILARMRYIVGQEAGGGFTLEASLHG